MSDPGKDPHPAGAARFIGRRCSFDHGKPPRRLVGIVEACEFVGRTERGAIPDYKITVRGDTGRTITTSLVESRANFPEL